MQSLECWLQPWNQKTVASWQESCDKPRQCVAKQRRYSAEKGLYSQGYGLPSGHVWLWELDHKEGRAQKNCCLEVVVLVKTPERPLDSKEIKPVNFKGDQPWILVRRIDAEAEGPLYWSCGGSRWLTGKVPDAGQDWGQKEKGWQRMRWLDDITNAMYTNLGKLQKMVRKRDVWHTVVHGVADTTGQMYNNNLLR